ncbi:hemerythrin domain-containing protein [Pendulispora brunnea]|uniref:Hemerythrin domain-containing protein n=1 Tax=Pendulispora brunnea TaxID=2905690 RepID=A0ABZ2KET8_9BACT
MAITLWNRRDAMRLGTAAGLGAFAAGCKRGADDEDILPPEDLMREHGALNRVLLVYEESARRLETPDLSPPFDALNGAADIIGRFIQDYHEKLEEEFLFPRFEKAGKLAELAATLREQHHAGRRLTERIRTLATPAAIASNAMAKGQLVGALRAFVRMYRPHEAREDTVLFPALREIMSHKELEKLGERFEGQEKELFGKKGFEGIVEQVARLESQLGIHDLHLFTPT